MAPPDIADLDLLDRARAGDRVAFDAVITTWSRPALTLALALTGDRKSARIATRRAFTSVWAALPGHHSRAPFRPLLLGAVGRAAIAARPHDLGGFAAAIGNLTEQEQIAVALSGLGYAPAEVALAIDASTRATRSATKRAKDVCGGRPLRDVVGEAAAGAELIAGTITLGASNDQPELVIQRRTATPIDDVWRALVDDRSVATWMGEQVRVHPASTIGPGTRVNAIAVVGSGRVAEHSRITIVERGRSLSWLTSLQIGRGSADVEQTWSVHIAETDDGTELVHTLRGHAVDPSYAGQRAGKRYERIAGSIAPSMHRRLARIASAAEAAARGATR